MKKDSELYDATEAYVKQVRPAIKQLLDLCDQHGVQLFGMTTYAIEETACHCGRCDGTGFGFKCDTFGVADPERMAELHVAIVALFQLPPYIQEQLIEAIITTASVVEAGGEVEVMPLAQLPGELPETNEFQAELRRMQSALRRRGDWHKN